MPEDNQCPSLLAGFLPSPLNKRDKTIQWYESAKQKHTASCFHALWIKLKFSSLGFRLRSAADAFTHTVFLCAMFRRSAQSNVKLSPLKKKVMNNKRRLRLLRFKSLKKWVRKSLWVLSCTTGGLPTVFNIFVLLNIFVEIVSSYITKCLSRKVK